MDLYIWSHPLVTKHYRVREGEGGRDNNHWHTLWTELNLEHATHVSDSVFVYNICFINLISLTKSWLSTSASFCNNKEATLRCLCSQAACRAVSPSCMS